MAANVNKVFLIGNLCEDPSVRFVQSGAAVCNIRLAVNRKYKAGNGEWKEETAFIGVETWGKEAEACGEYLKKGNPVHVEGRLKLNEWEKEGQKHSTLIVVAERVQFLQGRAKADEPLPF